MVTGVNNDDGSDADVREWLVVLVRMMMVMTVMVGWLLVLMKMTVVDGDDGWIPR